MDNTLEPRDDEAYPFQFSDEQVELAKSISLPDGWQCYGMIHSGFIRFTDEAKDSNYREASIGPTPEGDVRAYGGTEVVVDEYETDLIFEGDFEEALRKLKQWFYAGAPRKTE